MYARYIASSAECPNVCNSVDNNGQPCAFDWPGMKAGTTKSHKNRAATGNNGTTSKTVIFHSRAELGL